MSKASETCSANDSHGLKTQKERLKENQYMRVIERLEGYLEADEVVNEKAPVRACHRYLSHRINQLDYKRFNHFKSQSTASKKIQLLFNRKKLYDRNRPFEENHAQKVEDKTKPNTGIRQKTQSM